MAIFQDHFPSEVRLSDATVIGIVVLALVVARYFVDNRAPQGLPFLASITALLSGR